MSDKVYHKVGNFGGGYTPPGSWTRYPVTSPANIEASWGLGVLQTRYKVLQAATTCGILKPAADKWADKVS